MAPKKTSKARQQHRQQAREREQRLRLARFGGLVTLAVAALAAFGFYRAASAPGVEVDPGIMPANIDGPAGAPVSIVEFGDFGCPSCRSWANSGIKEQLQATFGDQISFTFRHFPVITARSPRAAEAGQCASAQGRFWDYHDYLYQAAPFLALSDDDLSSYAGAVGLDQAAFDQCLAEGAYRGYVGRDQQAAFAAGARGTPTFFINGRQAGFSFEAMAALIEEELQ